jgi:hypothetical protein
VSGAIPAADAAANGYPMFKVDASGRRYRIDEFGNRVLTGNRRPPYITSVGWTKMSPKRKDEAHAAWMAKRAQDAAKAASEVALGSVGSSTSLPAAAATQQVKHTIVGNEKRPNHNMMLMIMCGMMGILTGIDPSPVQVSALSGEFERVHESGPVATMAACVTVTADRRVRTATKGKRGGIPLLYRHTPMTAVLPNWWLMPPLGAIREKSVDTRWTLGIYLDSRARRRTPRTKSSNRPTVPTFKRVSPAR